MMKLNLKAKLKYVKETYGQTYRFIAKKAGIKETRLYRYLLSEDNYNYRDITEKEKEKLIEYLNNF